MTSQDKLIKEFLDPIVSPVWEWDMDRFTDSDRLYVLNSFKFKFWMFKRKLKMTWQDLRK